MDVSGKQLLFIGIACEPFICRWQFRATSSSPLHEYLDEEKRQMALDCATR